MSAVRVIVTHVSPHGSTRGIAERIAERLRESGLQVDCEPVHEIQRVDGYDAVVIGSAIHGRAWLTDASQFLSTHADELVVRPKWLYSLGMRVRWLARCAGWRCARVPRAVEVRSSTDNVPDRSVALIA